MTKVFVEQPLASPGSAKNVCTIKCYLLHNIVVTAKYPMPVVVIGIHDGVLPPVPQPALLLPARNRRGARTVPPRRSRTRFSQYTAVLLPDDGLPGLLPPAPPSEGLALAAGSPRLLARVALIGREDVAV